MREVEKSIRLLYLTKNKALGYVHRPSDCTAAPLDPLGGRECGRRLLLPHPFETDSFEDKVPRHASHWTHSSIMQHAQDSG